MYVYFSAFPPKKHKYTATLFEILAKMFLKHVHNKHCILKCTKTNISAKTSDIHVTQINHWISTDILTVIIRR